jgi:hypothetical protein
LIDIFLDCNNDNAIQSPLLISKLCRVNPESSVPAIKFLGIFIDPQLNFKYHIGTIISKVSKSLFILRSAKNILTFNALKSVYNALIHPHLIYGIQLWSCGNNALINKLYLCQKNALRIINNSTYNAHTEPLFKKCNILPLPLLIDFFHMQFMHLFLNGGLPALLMNMWQFHDQDEDDINNRRALRSHGSLRMPYPSMSSSDRFPLFIIPRKWSNFADVAIKSCNKKNLFSTMLKKHYLNTLASTMVCSRLLCPACHFNT